MKKNILTGFIAIAFIFIGCANKTVLSDNKLPSEVKTYITTHFPSHSIVQSIKDKDDFEITYDIILSDGVKLEFNCKKEIIEISGKSELPKSVIPEPIQSYITTNFPESYIIGWELKDNKNQQVELNNELELIFNKSGEFIRIED